MSDGSDTPEQNVIFNPSSSKVESLPPSLPTYLVNVLHHHTLCIINLGAELLQVIGRGVGVVELHHALEGGGEGLVHGKSDGLGREGGRERGREGGREGSSPCRLSRRRWT